MLVLPQLGVLACDEYPREALLPMRSGWSWDDGRWGGGKWRDREQWLVYEMKKKFKRTFNILSTSLTCFEYAIQHYNCRHNVMILELTIL